MQLGPISNYQSNREKSNSQQHLGAGKRIYTIGVVSATICRKTLSRDRQQMKRKNPDRTKSPEKIEKRRGWREKKRKDKRFRLPLIDSLKEKIVPR